MLERAAGCRSEWRDVRCCSTEFQLTLGRSPKVLGLLHPRKWTQCPRGHWIVRGDTCVRCEQWNREQYAKTCGSGAVSRRAETLTLLGRAGRI
jgi:hypothetical protein